jgi:hypothetical protein
MSSLVLYDKRAQYVVILRQSCIRSVLEKQIVQRTRRLIPLRLRRGLLLQSVDESLRLPLLQIGACRRVGRQRVASVGTFLTA